MATVDRSGLRPELRRFLEDWDRSPPASATTPAAARAAADVEIRALWGDGEPVDSIADLSIRDVAAPLRARLYRPARSLGTVMFVHGGGWAVGSLDSHDGSCRRLANSVPCDVLSVDYRKTPEHPFPAGLNDVLAGLEWLMANGGEHGLSVDRLVLAGESAGANLAAVVARRARDSKVALCGQLLIQPVTDLTMATDSYRELAEGYRVTAAGLAAAIAQYVPDESVRTHPDASPLRAADLSGLAPALILTAEFDPLRDDGRRYAERLIASGNDVSYVETKGGIHSLWVMNAVTPLAGELVQGAASWVRSRFEKHPA